MPAQHPDVVTTAEVLARPRSSHDQQPDSTLPPVFVVPVNYSRSSEAALHLALLLAAPSGAKIVVVRIVPAQPRTAASRSEDAGRTDEDRASPGICRQVLLRFAREDEARSDRRGRHRGRAQNRRARRRSRSALIIMGASGDGMRRRLFGSIVERTRRLATCPVVTIGARAPRAGDGSRRVAVAPAPH